MYVQSLAHCTHAVITAVNDDGSGGGDDAPIIEIPEERDKLSQISSCLFIHPILCSNHTTLCFFNLLSYIFLCQEYSVPLSGELILFFFFKFNSTIMRQDRTVHRQLPKDRPGLLPRPVHCPTEHPGRWAGRPTLSPASPAQRARTLG